MTQVGIGKYLLEKLDQFSEPNCSGFPKVYDVLKLFVRMRIYYASKFGNRELSTISKKKENILRFSIYNYYTHWKNVSILLLL